MICNIKFISIIDLYSSWYHPYTSSQVIIITRSSGKDFCNLNNFPIKRRNYFKILLCFSVFHFFCPSFTFHISLFTLSLCFFVSFLLCFRPTLKVLEIAKIFNNILPIYTRLFKSLQKAVKPQFLVFLRQNNYFETSN